MSIVPSLIIFRHRGYRYFWIARQFIAAERQMVAVAMGWQIYELARQDRSIEESAFLLGLVGLAQFLPVFLLSLYGGQFADRFNRKLILIGTTLTRILILMGLFYVCFAPAEVAIPAIFLAATAMGAANAFTPAAANALFPNLVPKDQLPLAIAWNSLGFQTAAILGPALVGLLYLGGPQTVYAVALFLVLLALASLSIVRAPANTFSGEQRSLAMILEGLRYVRDNRILLGAISLDLIVVFFGGVTALLPVFARDILDVGTEGLGIMRAAPAAGAAVVAFLLALRGITNRAGPWMLTAIAVYGMAMLGFAVSKLFWLSCLMLAVTGAADMISVYIRSSLIQLATPDAMRGRVSSVSFIFIAASNELGEFESGVAARFLGPVGAVLLGGVVSITCAVSWVRLFPRLSRADRLDDTSV